MAIPLKHFKMLVVTKSMMLVNTENEISQKIILFSTNMYNLCMIRFIGVGRHIERAHAYSNGVH